MNRRGFLGRIASVALGTLAACYAPASLRRPIVVELEPLNVWSMMVTRDEHGNVALGPLPGVGGTLSSVPATLHVMEWTDEPT